jgi:uncharacterized protein (DUF362 family)
MSNLVACVEASSNIEESLEKAIDLAGGFSPVEGANIVIKPNLCASHKGCGVTTDLEIVKALVKYIRSRQKRCEITVVEGDSDSSATVAFKKLGYVEWAKKADVKLKNTSEDRVVKLLLPRGKRLRSLLVPETLLFMDYFISVACLKRQAAERLTGIWKNQYGCIPQKHVRLDLHPFMSEVLFDLNSVYWADLSIMDARFGLEGSGPIEGTPKPIGLIMCSKNPLSTDVFAFGLVEKKAKKVPSIGYALRKGFSDSSRFQVVGKLDCQEISLRYISRVQYILYRLGMRFRRIGLYFVNIGTLFGVVAFALRVQKFEELAKGKLLPTAYWPRLAWHMITKFETTQRNN